MVPTLFPSPLVPAARRPQDAYGGLDLAGLGSSPGRKKSPSQQRPHTGDSLDVFMDEAGAPSPADRPVLPSSLLCPKPMPGGLGTGPPAAGGMVGAGPSFEF